MNFHVINWNGNALIMIMLVAWSYIVKGVTFPTDPRLAVPIIPCEY